MNPKEYINASNGDGEAVRAIVTEDRGIGNLALVVDSVLNWPHKFVATSGEVDEEDRFIPETVTVFRGYLDGSIVMIEEFAPSYSDIGNTENQVVVLKPTTLWADLVAQSLEEPGVPAGGIEGQVLTKLSDDDGDVGWEDGGGDSTWVFNETPSGAVDGSNTVFTVVGPANNVIVTLNGLVQRPGVGNDYTITGNTITFEDAPVSGDVILVTYTSLAGTTVVGSNSIAWKEAAAGVINSVNAVFTTAGGRAYIGGSLQVYVNGIAQGTSVTETNPATGTFTLDLAPLTGSEVEVSYQFVQSVTANADTVDGYHAQELPTANTIPVLNPQKFLTAASIGSTLVVAENTEKLTWSGTVKTKWTIGTWSQYGLFAETSNPNIIKITVPAGKQYTIKLTHLCSAVQSPNGNWGHSGIVKLNPSTLAVETFLTSSMNANGDNYHPETSECVQVLTEGDHYFCLWVRTNTTTSNNVWYGGGDSTATSGTYDFGRSAVFSAVLLNVEDA